MVLSNLLAGDLNLTQYFFDTITFDNEALRQIIWHIIRNFRIKDEHR